MMAALQNLGHYGDYILWKTEQNTTLLIKVAHHRVKIDSNLHTT